MSQQNLLNFFKRTDSYELPSQWTSEPLPPSAEKRPVGRPRKKRQKLAIETESPSRDGQNQQNEPALSSDSRANPMDPVASTSLEMKPTIVQPQLSADAKPTDEENLPVGVEGAKEASSAQTSIPSASSEVSTIRGKYKAYTVAEKQAIVQEAKERGIRVTAADRRIAVGTLHGWMKANFTEIQSQTKKGVRRAGGGRKLAIGDSDDEILKWILQQREMHIPVSRQSIQDYAKRLCTETNPDFVASSGWLDKFMRRHHLSLRSRTSMSQKLPADLEDKVSSFHQFVRKQRIEDEYEENFIVNMDETPVFFDLVPNKTVEQQGNKSVIIRTSGSDKRHVTVILSVSASGDVLPTFVIFKGKRALKDIKAPSDITVLVQEKAWVDESIMLKWVDDSLRVYTNRNRSLLVMDSFRCHLMDSVKKRLRKTNAETAIIPGTAVQCNVTSHYVCIFHTLGETLTNQVG